MAIIHITDATIRGGPPRGTDETMGQDTIDDAIELATKGQPRQAIEQLWPLVHRDATRNQAVFALAYCFEREENIATAAYLYGWVAEREPEFDLAEDRFRRCREAAEAQGLVEDFQDSGHAACPCGLLQYRAEFGACPYCGKRPEDADAATSDVEAAVPEVVPEQDAELAPPEPSQAGGSGALERLDAWSKKANLGDLGERINDLAQETSQRLKDLSETEAARNAAEKLHDLRDGAGQRTKALMDNERVQAAAENARELRQEVSGRMQSFADREDVKRARAGVEKWGRETTGRLRDWARSETVRARVGSVIDGLEGVLAKIQAQIDRMKK